MTFIRVLVLLLSLGASSVVAAPSFKRVEALLKDDKTQAALTEVDKIIAAKPVGEDAVKAYVIRAQLQTVLGRAETAVSDWRKVVRPKDTATNALLALHGARLWQNYLQSNGYEIDQREQTAGSQDVAKWTRQQIVDAILTEFAVAWNDREALGKPLKAWDTYLNINNYPAGIRDTQRDALSYYLAEFLADSANWTPGEQNNVYGLPLAELGDDDADDVPTPKPTDDARHPVERAAAVLADLEEWHEDDDRDGAALNAHVTRMQLLKDAFSDEASQVWLRRQLTDYLDDQKSNAWWPAGMAVLAGWLQDAGDHRGAHAVATVCAKRDPGSIGGKQCEARRAALEEPRFEIEAMAVDAPDRESVRIEHRNMTKLYWRAYKVGLETVIGRAGMAKKIAAVLKAKPMQEWQTELKDPGDFKDHRTFAKPKVVQKGFYLLLASADQAFKPKQSRVEGVFFNISNLVVINHVEDGGAMTATVTDGRHGTPVAGAEVLFYNSDTDAVMKKTDALKTNAKGQVVKRVQGYGGYYLVARLGDDVTLDRSPRYVYSQGHRDRPITSSFVYTDRSVYRPGQTIKFKVIAYSGVAARGDFRVQRDKKLYIKLKDAGGEQTDLESLTTNKYGSASGSFKIPAGRPLGSWFLEVAGGGSASVQVEEYKRPTYEVTITDPAAPLRLNREAALIGEARYYFGQPVTSGSITWRVTRERRYPWWWHYWGGGGNDGAEPIADGKARLDADGTFKVTFVPKADEKEAKSGVTYRYQLTVDATDDGGETRSAERAFSIGFAAVTSAIEAASGFFAQNAAFTVKRTDLDGAPKAGEGTWRLIALEQPKAPKMPSELPKRAEPGKKPDASALPGDDKVPRWESNYNQAEQLGRWEDGDELKAGSVSHGKDGVAQIKLTGLKPGAYRLRYATKDEFGAEQASWNDFVVTNQSGKGLPLALPAFMKLADATVKAGQPVRVLIHTALPKQAVILDVFSAGALVERRVLKGTNIGVVDIPTTTAMRGGLGLRLTVVHDHQLITLSERVAIPWDNRDVQLSFSRFRDRMTPGGKETWRVKVAGPKPGDGIELLAYMYDRSLDLFAPHHPPDPRYILPDRSDVPYSDSSISAEHGQAPWTAKREKLPRPPELQGDSLKYLGGRHRGFLGSSFNKYESYNLEESVADDAESDAAASAPMAASPEPRMAKKSRAVDFDAGDIGGQRKTPMGLMIPTQAPASEPIRQNFSETAFFKPHLLVDAKGEVALEFDVPDSVTSWTVWVHAIRSDLGAGNLTRQSRTAKDLLVRPYLTRFLREGDETTWRVMVNNDSGKALKGNVELSITDPETGADLASRFGVKDKTAAFDVGTGKSATVSFKLDVPNRVQPVAVTIKGVAGDLSDGERHLVPVLPSRIRVSESKFAYLDKKGSRTLAFKAPKDDDTFTTEQLIVTVDGQLFYGALNALPYLIDYPYECTEQTLNRFVSTGIMSSLFKRYPAVAAASQSMQKRNTRWEPWDAGDPNRRMQLEETPWMFTAKGGDSDRLIKVLDPRLVNAERKAALAKLEKARNSDGGLPWFPGGRSSPYMTLYTLLGLAKATEFGLEAPTNLINGAWRYLAHHFREEWRDELAKPASKGCCVESLVLLNYVATALPAGKALDQALSPKDRQAILEYTYERRKNLSLYLKSFLALTLKRMNRAPDAVRLMDSVMDAARTDEDLGTYWAPEERSWLWFNDSIESHSWAMRALQEIAPKHKQLPGLVRWLFLNKKLSHWKSTRATAEAIYALAHYMDKEALLSASESLTVKAAKKSTTMTFAPGKFTGKSQWRLGPADFGAGSAPTVSLQKTTRSPMLASATWHYATTTPPVEDRGDLLAVSRKYFKRNFVKGEAQLMPLNKGDGVDVGDEVEVQLTVRAKHAAEYVHLNDPRPAGFEPVQLTSGHRYDLGVSRFEEVRDSGTNLFFEWLPAGEYVMKHRIRAANGGRFNVAPATLQSLYAPEFTAYTAGAQLKVANQ